MADEARNKPGRRPKRKVRSGDVQGARFIAQVIDLFKPLRQADPDPKRLLHYDQYCCWLLLYFFTPIIDSLRGLQQASDIPSIRRKLRLPRFSLGSFSEAASVFDAQLLVPIIEQLGARLADIEPDARLAGLGTRPTVVDGTLLHALPRMVWALWRDDQHRAAKLHLQFDLLKGAPHSATLSDGQSSETDQFRASLQGGRLYVNDRGYFDYGLMADILEASSSFVIRARENIVYEIIEERPLGPLGPGCRLQADLIVRAGCDTLRRKVDRPLRLVRFEVTGCPTPRPIASIPRPRLTAPEKPTTPSRS